MSGCFACSGCGYGNCTSGMSNCPQCGVTLNEFPTAATVNLDDNVVLSNDKKLRVGDLLTALGAEPIDTDLSQFPDGTILQVVGGELIASAMIQDADSVNSTLDIEVPDDSLIFGGVAVVSHVGEYLATGTGSLNRAIMSYNVDPVAGASLPQWIDVPVAALVAVQNLFPTSDTQSQFDFDLSSLVTSDNAAVLFQVQLKSLAEVSGLRLSVYRDSIAEENKIWQNVTDTQWNAGEGYSLTVGDNTLDSIFVLDKGNSYFMRLEVNPSTSDTITLEGVVSGSFMPYLIANVSQSPSYDLLTTRGNPEGTITVDTDYVVGGFEDYIRVTGSRNITMPATRAKNVGIYAATDSVTIDVSNTSAGVIENTSATLPVGTAVILTYDSDFGGYYNNCEPRVSDKGSFVINFGNNGISSSTATRYLVPYCSPTYQTAPTLRIEGVADFDLDVFSMTAFHDIPQGNGNNITYTLEKNGVPVALSVTLASTDEIAQSAVLETPISFNRGDKFSMRVTKSGTIGASPDGVLVILKAKER